ncbi:MAG: YhcH/YjgK/YiaL family protein [Anaerolineae bacterium]|nr:YhcH/YjgK/YiaL family protein [Anaerolineae bacterium]
MMIVGNLDEISEQCRLSARLKTALDYLREIKGNDIADGRVPIDGTDVYAIVQSYDSKPVLDTLKFEAHREVIDVQYIVSGNELMGWSHVSTLKTTIPYNEEKDAVYGVVSPDQVTYVHYGAGQAVILFPSDAHAPGLADGASQPVKKIVVKVKL